MNPRALTRILLAALLTGCTTTGSRESATGETPWDGRVQRWGSLRAVMRGGQKEGRVRIADELSPDSVGLGALAGLAGEVLVVDGEAWVGRSGSGLVEVDRAGAEEEAALLLLADVSAWRASVLERDLDVDEVHPPGHGSAAHTTVPFIVRGDLADVELHVLAGRCPYSPDDPEGELPLTASFDRVRGTIVGFYSEQAPGLVTHHGTRIHAHVLVEHPQPYVGHVDAATILSGAELLVPRP